ncbi:MAG TPA: hypothetical protein VN742_00850 [Candidatus Binataceae bacterium]|nr:hypothetical protein [Candidatus Binataceae bacterium]
MANLHSSERVEFAETIFAKLDLHQECPIIKRIGNYAVLGLCGYLDIFETPDAEVATKVALHGDVL